MNSKSWPAVLAKVLGNVVCDTLSTDEDENFRILLADLVEVLNELGSLLKVAANFNDLSDVVVSRQFHRADVDLNEIAQEIL